MSCLDHGARPERHQQPNQRERRQTEVHNGGTEQRRGVRIHAAWLFRNYLHYWRLLMVTMTSRALLGRVAVVSSLLALVGTSLPDAASVAVGGVSLRTIIPTAATTVDNVIVDPTCDTQGGTSMAIVPGSKLAGVSSVKFPVLLAISCLDNGGSATAVQRRSRVNFVDPGLDPVTGLPSGKVIKSIPTTLAGAPFTPSNGWAHLVHRPDIGDLLGCGNDGSIYSIDYQPNSTADGTATAVPRPAGLPGNCVALGWDAEEDMIYQGISGGTGTVGVYRFKFGTTTLLQPFNTPCTPSGVAITGGVLVVACDGVSTILRLDKISGAILNPNGTLGVLGLAPGTNLNPDLGDLACDPVTFHKNPATGKDQFKDAMWSRNGANGNGAVALEFPAFTCGLPSNATVFRAGLSAPGPLGLPGEVLRPGCFDGAGNVIDDDNDGIPDCWETSGLDFDGDGVVDLQLCVQVDTNGDGIADATECAQPNHKDLFVEIDYMQGRKPDPRALSQVQSVPTVGVQSVREAFAAAPVANLDGLPGIRIHFQVDEQVTFTTLAGTTATQVTEVSFTPCTPPGVKPDGSLNAKSLSDAADFDTIKKANFGTAAERNTPNFANILNAKRLVFRYVLFANKQVGLNQGGASNSGCGEVGGDDAVITLGGFTGTTDQQAGTLMHELGHTLGLRHGGGDGFNCKPNYRSVMSYSRQFAGSPIPNRRLDYSRVADPVLTDATKTGRLNEASLDELAGMGLGLNANGVNTLGPLPPFFPSADQFAFGPSAWSVVVAPTGTDPRINWNRSKQGPNPTFQNNATANINSGPGGCDTEPTGTLLEGHDDWSNLLYRFSAALDFAGGFHTENSQELTKEQEEALFLAADVDANGVADAQDCVSFANGTVFTCSHRIDIKPSFPLPKTINLGTEATVTIAIFSEGSGALVWDAPAQVKTDATLTFTVGSLVLPVKVNNSGGGTCSVADVEDLAGKKDGIKDLRCQFPTSGIPSGTHQGIVSGFFFATVGGVSELRAFRARQVFTVLP